jgi:cell division protein FtsA
MNFFKSIYPKRALWILDFGAEKTVALAAERREDGSFRVLGAGDSRTLGLESGRVVHLGDAAESAVDALRKAERSAGVKPKRVYINFDDPLIQSVRARGSKSLSGEGEIGRDEAREAIQTAARTVERFERSTVYSFVTGYIIDDRDPVENPLGVFGRKLEASVYFLQARSEICEDWKRVAARAHLEESILVLSCWSMACGVLPPKDRVRKRLIIDLGRDFINLVVFEKNGICDYRIIASGPERDILEAARELAAGHENPMEVLITGDLAEDAGILNVLKEGLETPVNVAAPYAGAVSGTTILNQPRYSSVVGLLGIADEMEKKDLLAVQRGFFNSVKGRAMEFINEYF